MPVDPTIPPVRTIRRLSPAQVAWLRKRIRRDYNLYWRLGNKQWGFVRDRETQAFVCAVTAIVHYLHVLEGLAYYSAGVDDGDAAAEDAALWVGDGI